MDEKELLSTEYICPLYHERLIYFFANDIFTKDELENDKFIEKFGLDARYRDYKIITKDDLPAGMPVEKVTFNKNNNTAIVVSIRAMHRIACSELGTKSIHFMFNWNIKWKMFNYDNDHGSLIKFMIHNREVPAKWLFRIHLANNKYLDLIGIRFEDIWNLDNEPGMLIYYVENNTIKSMYIDKNKIASLQIFDIQTVQFVNQTKER